MVVMDAMNDGARVTDGSDGRTEWLACCRRFGTQEFFLVCFDAQKLEPQSHCCINLKAT